VTVSIGAAEPGEGMTHAQVLKAADEALYRAKRGGRNRVSR
jgi:PleD family two-component response regulator